MLLLIFIILGLLILKVFAKWWIRLINMIFDPVIEYYENKEPQANIYIAKHHRKIEEHKKAEELRESFRKGYEH